jgi:hypothetical protein
LHLQIRSCTDRLKLMGTFERAKLAASDSSHSCFTAYVKAKLLLQNWLPLFLHSSSASGFP